jgi:hypothetical protein
MAEVMYGGVVDASGEAVPRQVLVTLLDARRRRLFLEACARIEQAYTAECAATNDPCLESGCAIDHAAGEVCLQPLVRAGRDYDAACAAEWVKLVEGP